MEFSRRGIAMPFRAFSDPLTNKCFEKQDFQRESNIYMLLWLHAHQSVIIFPIEDE